MLAGASQTLKGNKDDKIDDGILTAFEAMNLNLDNTGITDVGMATLKTLTGLTELRVDSADVSDASISILETMRGMKSMNLYHTLVTEQGYARLRASFPACEIIWDRDSILPNRRKG